MAITGPVIVRAAESQNDHEKRRRKATPRRFPTSRIFCFENYSKYVKLFDEIFMRRG